MVKIKVLSFIFEKIPKSNTSVKNMFVPHLGAASFILLLPAKERRFWNKIRFLNTRLPPTANFLARPHNFKWIDPWCAYNKQLTIGMGMKWR